MYSSRTVEYTTFRMQIPPFGTPRDTNHYCQNILCTSTYSRLWNKSFRAPGSTWSVLAVHQLLCTSCRTPVGLPQSVKLLYYGCSGVKEHYGSPVRSKNGRLASNCVLTLFNWSQVCLWKHFKRGIYERKTQMCRFAEQGENRLGGESFCPKHSSGLSLQIHTRAMIHAIGAFLSVDTWPHAV